MNKIWKGQIGMKKFTASLVALLVALMPAFAENADTAVFEKMCRLMFNENNVTLTMQAQFDVDGDVFAIELPDDVYNRLYDLYFDYIEEYTDEGFALIDSDWAMQTARYALMG